MKNLLTLSILGFMAAAHGQSTTWYEIPSGTDKQLNTIEFASPMVGYIGGNDSLLLKSTDGGLTWSSVNYTGVTFYPGGEHILNLQFVSENVGYMTVGPYSGTYKTLDGGTSWTAVSFIGTMCYNQGMYFFSEDNGVFGGAGCFQGEHMELMNNGTLTESIIHSPSWDATDYIRDIDFRNPNYGLAVSKSRFLRTTDGGVNWDTIPSGFPDFLLTSIRIIDDTLAYAGYTSMGGGYGLLKTTDAGLTWSGEFDMATFFYPDYNDVIQTADGHIFTVGKVAVDQYGIIFEKGGSLGWWYQTTDHTLRGADSYGDSTVFAVGDSGFIVTNLNPSSAGMEELLSNGSTLTVYPNPVSEVLTIEGSTFGQGTLLQITVWDLSGQKVRSLETKVPEINVVDLESGHYLLEIQTDKDRFVERFVKQ